MSNVTDRGVIDITLEEDNKYVLIIIDTLEWKFSNRENHGRILQDKINDYLQYIVSGQAAEAKPNLRPVIRIIAQYSYSQYCIDFLERVRKFIKGKGDICDIEWKHEGDEIFDDGFSDDYVFEPEKIYPRLKKNWAKDFRNEVALMGTGANPTLKNYPDNLIMFRCMESYIGLFVADVGDCFTYVTYDMIPEDVSVEELEQMAIQNISNQIEYRWVESKVAGIYGIVAGGNFEAESILFEGIWETISQQLEDDIVICIPTKDMVYYTKLSDKKRTKKMINMAQKTYNSNLEDEQQPVFSKDIFYYLRSEKKIFVGTEHIQH